MNWIEIAAIVVLLLGIGTGGFLVAQKPSFWLSLLMDIAKEALPLLKKRNTPEIERQMQDCVRRGGEWDNFRKRCKR